MADEELARNVARAHPNECQLNYALPYVQRQRAPIDEDSAQLVDSCLAYCLVGRFEFASSFLFETRVSLAVRAFGAFRCFSDAFIDMYIA